MRDRPWSDDIVFARSALTTVERETWQRRGDLVQEYEPNAVRRTDAMPSIPSPLRSDVMVSALGSLIRTKTWALWEFATVSRIVY
jgi:hypothetical protein